MKLNSSTDHAFQIMIFITESKGRVSSRKICEHQQISQRYFFRIIAKLRNAGLVKTELGPEGGYSLGREAFNITMFDIIVAMEGSILPPYYLENYTMRSTLNPVYEFSYTYLMDYLKRVSLDLLQSTSYTDWLSATIDHIHRERLDLLAER